jgi:hypothetical protein
MMLNRSENAALKMFVRADRVLDLAEMPDARRRAFETLKAGKLVTLQAGASKWGSNPSKWGAPSQRYWRLTKKGTQALDLLTAPKTEH